MIQESASQLLGVSACRVQIRILGFIKDRIDGSELFVTRFLDLDTMYELSQRRPRLGHSIKANPHGISVILWQWPGQSGS